MGFAGGAEPARTIRGRYLYLSIRKTYCLRYRDLVMSLTDIRARWLFRCACCLAVWGCPLPAWGAEKVALYTSYTDPPYATREVGNLTTLLADWLTRHAEGRYEFVATQLPRRRMDLLLTKPDWDGVVAWGNPVWFNDEARQRYAWSQPYMQDSDLVVSRKDKPVEYETGGRTLIGLKLGGIIGHRYAEIEPLLNSGQIVRDDAVSGEQSLRKLQHGRVDFCFLQASALPYFRRTLPGFEEWAHLAREPRARYQRYLFASKKQQALIHYLDLQLELLQKDPDWQAVLKPGR